MPETIGEAYIQIRPSVDGISNSIENILDPEAQKAGNSASSKMASAFKGGLAGLAKVSATALAGVGTGLVKLSKDSVSAYGSYEQLIGGVETLFGDSAGKLEAYANEAYKTAGLSANKYMETVTSFSASLLQSLGGDTDKSAETANQALIDMSDNANKMGTSMESIQNAYQGFAKQNYTMLDNLKLGYGGTKSEMERLLADAEKISGVKYDISNLADVYNAIHVIQGELGITGTTAKEASTTIQGSIGMLKGSWQNLLTGIANSDADMTGLITQFVDSAGTAFDNLMPRIEQTIQGAGTLVTNLAPVIMEKLPQLVSMVLPTLLEAITNAGNSLAEVIPPLIGVLVSTISDNLPAIIDSALNIILALVQGILQSLPTLIPATIEAIMTLVMGLLDNIDLLIDCAIQLVIGLAEGLILGLPKIIEKVPEIVGKLVSALITNAPKLQKASLELVTKLAVGLVSNVGLLLSKGGEILVALYNKLMSFGSTFSEIGHNIIQGIKNGIANAWNNLVSWFSGLFDDLIGIAERILGIASPSKVFKKIGQYTTEGFDIGMKDFGKGAIEQVEDSVSELSSMDLANTIVTGNTAINSAEIQPQTDNSQIMSLLSQYLPSMAQPTNVNVGLQGDASSLFRVVRNEANKFTKSTGYSAFA